MSKLGALAEPAIVGREKELEELESFLNSAIAGNGKTVFISGEAGVGKTRLITDFIHEAKKLGVRTLIGWCLSNAAVPYFPFFEAFNAYLKERTERVGVLGAELGETKAKQVDDKITWGPEDVDIMSWLLGPTQAEQLGKSQTLSPQVWKDQTFAAVTKTLLAIASKEPTILFIEDVHWADSASLALIHYIARATTSEKVLLIAAFRSEELTADAEGRPHPLVETLRLMKREDLYQEIKVGNLNSKVVAEIAENMLDGNVQRELTAKLAKESQGNPLFVVESLRMLHEGGSLINDHNEWRLAHGDIGIPDKIRDIILQRLSCLTRAQRKVLDVASVIGERFDAQLVALTLGLELSVIIEDLDGIGQITALVCCEGELYRFDNARSREAIYDGISPLQRRVFHVKVAEKLVEIGTVGMMPLSDLAYHYAQAGNNEKAIGYALAAAKDELARWSNAEAIMHFEYVLRNIPAGHSETRVTALEGLGDAYAASYMYGEALKTYDKLAGSESGLIRLRALRKAIDVSFLKGDAPDLLLEYTRKAEEVSVDSRLEEARVINSRARAWGFSGGGDLTMDLADYDVVLQIFEEENSILDAADALSRSGLYSVFFEDSREKGLGKLIRSIAIFREIGDIRKEIEATLNAGLAFLFFCGLLPEAKREYSNVLRMGEKLDVFAEMAQASALYYDGCCYLDQGKEALAEPVAQALKGLEYCKKTDVTWIQGILYATLTRLYCKLGDLAHADEYFEKIMKLSPEIQSHFLNIIAIAVCKGVYFAAKGRWGESNQCFKELLDYSNTYPGQEITNRANYAWALEKQGRLEEAKVQHERIQIVLQRAEEKYGHASVQLSLMVPRKLEIGAKFEMRLDFVNVGRKSAKLAKVGSLATPELAFLNLPSYCTVQGRDVLFKDKNIGPFEAETIKLEILATEAGNYRLNPEILFEDDLGNSRTFRVNPVTITVEPAKPIFEVVRGRAITGTMELDRLLLGGIPEKRAVVLMASPSDERQRLIKRFLEAGPRNGEPTIYLTCEATHAEELAEASQTDFYVLACNPQANAAIPSSSNVLKLSGVENLTEIDIALNRLFRTTNLLQHQPKRFCLDLLSDVLLQHHAVTTRKWLTGLITGLKAKGFTTMAVIDPFILTDEVPAIAGLFDGELRIVEKGGVKALKILRLQDGSYLKDEVTLG